MCRLSQVHATRRILRVNVDRTLADQIGLTQKDVASDLLVSLSRSGQTAPNFWVNPKNGVNYSILVQTPQYQMDPASTQLENTPIVPGGREHRRRTIRNCWATSRRMRRGIDADQCDALQHHSTLTTC